ncbi:hypothetical protein PMAYCL1PPCAC_11074, partial [Pristionchus mayeri]
IKGLPLAPDWKKVDPDLMNYYSINKSFIDDVSPEMKFGYHRNLLEYYEEMDEYDENVTQMKRKILNTPVQYKKALILSPEKWNIIDIIIYATAITFLLFIGFKVYQFSQGNRDEDETLL